MIICTKSFKFEFKRSDFIKKKLFRFYALRESKQNTYTTDDKQIFVLIMISKYRSIHVQIVCWLKEVRVGNTKEIDWETVNEKLKKQC